MIGFIEALNAMHTRALSISYKDYLFALLITLGCDKEQSYALSYEPQEMNKVLGSEDEDTYFDGLKEKAKIECEQQHITQLVDLLGEDYRGEVQRAALNLKDFKFNGKEAIQILNALLKNRIEDIDSASVRDVVGIIKTLSEQGALDIGDGGFSRHFITIPPKYSTLCPYCNHEGYAVHGLDFKCEHCGEVVHWDETTQRFYPHMESL